jgi:hypothetical protein
LQALGMGWQEKAAARVDSGGGLLHQVSRRPVKK